MKKYLFGIIAVVLAVGFSSFTMPKKDNTANKNFANKYFRIVNHTYTEMQPVLQADAQYLGESDPGSAGCPGGSKQCVSVFTPSQVNGSNQLIDNNQVPLSYPHKKS